MVKFFSSIFDSISIIKDGPQAYFDGQLSLINSIVFTFLGLMAFIFDGPAASKDFFVIAFSTGWPFLAIGVLAMVGLWVKNSINN